MAFLLFFFYLGCYSVGLAALVLLLALSVREKSAVFRSEFHLLLSVGAIAIIETFGIAAQDIWWDPLTDFSINVFLIPGAIVYYGWATLAYHRKVRLRAGNLLVDGCLLALVVTVSLGFPLAHLAQPWVLVIRIVLAVGLSLFMLFTSGRILMDFRGNRDLYRNNSDLRLARAVAAVTMALVPALFLLDWGFITIWGWITDDRIHLVQTVPLWFALGGAVWIRGRLPALLHRAAPEPQVSEGWKLDDEFCRRYQISDREREVAGLLLAGKSYPEMAAQLFISLATIKTHVHRVYQKTGVGNKMALLHLLQPPGPVQRKS